jgi:putative membrane protein
MPEFLPPVLLVGAAGIVYGLALRRPLRVVSAPPRRFGDRQRRAAAFYLGLATILAALVGPIDVASEQLFWIHMIQHVLLMTVAAPLIVIGAPWLAPIRLLSSRGRRSVGHAAFRSAWAMPLRSIGRFMAFPVAAWMAFNVNLIVWHVPVVYDETLRNQGVHDVEHVSFLVLGIVFWTQVIDSRPFRGRLNDFQRAIYLTAAAMVGWGLSIFLAFASTALYAPYAALATRPGGISALADQQLAAGVMWGPGSIAFGIGVFVCLYRWLGADVAMEGRVSGLAVPRAPPSAAVHRPVLIEED